MFFQCNFHIGSKSNKIKFVTIFFDEDILIHSIQYINEYNLEVNKEKLFNPYAQLNNKFIYSTLYFSIFYIEKIDEVTEL